MRLSKRGKEMRALVEQELDRRAAAMLTEACRQRDRDDALVQTAAAIAAVAWHAKHASAHSWALPLPVREEACDTLLSTPHNELKLLAHFSNSLRRSRFDIARHPAFPLFCQGVLACDCPVELQRDSALRQLFPPTPVAGITSGFSPQWRAAA